MLSEQEIKMHRRVIAAREWQSKYIAETYPNYADLPAEEQIRVIREAAALARKRVLSC